MENRKFSLIDIYFGESIAEQEKNDLPKYFLTTNAFLNAKDNKRKKLFYIGHRGSGKSALFQVLLHDFNLDKKRINIEIKPLEFSYEAFQKINHNFNDIKFAYSNAWVFTLFIELFKETVNYFRSNSNLKRNRESAELINKFLISNNFILEEDKLSLLIDYLEKISLEKNQLTFDARKINKKNSIGSTLSKILNYSDLNRPINALKEIANSHPISIFIDELDTGWNNTKESKHFISGLISAAMQLNCIENINVYLSLRKDMYDNLADVFYDTEKIRDNVEFIEWSKVRLKNLINKRLLDNQSIADFLKSNQLVDSKAIDLVFEPDAVDYLLKHTLMRPREIISFCNRLVNKYRDINIDLALERFNIEFIKTIEYSFCSDRYKDFCVEYNFEFPGIKEFLDCFEGQNYIYDRVDFEKVLVNNILDVLESYTEQDWHSTYLDSPISLVRKLYEIGFIMVSFDSIEYTTYYDRGINKYNNIKKIKLNNVFRKALFCSETHCDDSDITD